MRQMKDSGFPWIGAVPENWGIRKLKHYYKMQTGFTPDTKKQEFYDDEFGFDWVNISDLQDGATITETKKKISQLYVEQFNPDLIPKGSLMYSFKLSVGQTSFAGKPIYSNEAIASFLADDNVDLHYLRYSSIFIIENAQTNIYNAKILNQDLINNAYVPFPPLPEQHLISAYLDRQCTLIDSVTEKTKASIEEYKKLRQAVITQAVTKGVRGDRAMKDSGIEWIGEIPEEWHLIKITRMLAENHPYPMGDGDHGLIKTDDYRDEGVPYLRVQNLGWGTELLLDNVVYISEEKNEQIKNSTLRPNDILFAKTGATIGKTGIIPESLPISNTTSHIGKITLSEKYHPRFVFYVLSSPIGYKQFWQIAIQKTTRPELSIEEMRGIKILVPNTYEEQEEITSYLDEKCSKIDKIITKKEQFLTELNTYKKSLIYEYDTGKKEVPQV